MLLCFKLSNFHDLCVAGLLQLEMEPSKVYQLLSGLSIPIPHLPLLEPVSSGVSTKLTSPPSVPVPQQSVEEKSPVSGDNKSTLDGNEGVLVGYKGTMDGNQGDSKGTLDGNQVVQGGYKGTVDGNQGVQGGYKGTLDGNQVILDDDKGTLGDSKGRLGGIQDTVGDSQGAVGDNRGTQDRNQGVLDENRDNLDKHLLIHKGFSEARTVFVEKTSTTSVWFMERDLYGGEAELETPFVGLSVFPLRKWRETSVDSPSTELTDALGDVQRGQDPVYNDRPKSVVQHEGETSPSYKASCVPSLEKTRTKRSMKKILFPQNVASGAHRQSPLVAANMGMKTVHSPLAVADVGIKTVHSPLVTADVGIKTVHSPLVTADAGIKTVHSPLVAADVGIKTVHSPLVAADVDMKTVHSPLVAAVNMKTVPSPLVVATDCNRSSVTKTTQCPQGEAVIHRKVEEVQCPQGVGSGVSRGQGDPVRQSYDYQKRRKRKTGPCQPQKAAQTLADWPFQDVLAVSGTLICTPFHNLDFINPITSELINLLCNDTASRSFTVSSIKFTNQVNLGITIDSYLSLHLLMTYVSSSANIELHHVASIHLYLFCDTTNTQISAYVFSELDLWEHPGISLKKPKGLECWGVVTARLVV